MQCDSKWKPSLTESEDESDLSSPNELTNLWMRWNMSPSRFTSSTPPLWPAQEPISIICSCSCVQMSNPSTSRISVVTVWPIIRILPVIRPERQLAEKLSTSLTAAVTCWWMNTRKLTSPSWWRTSTWRPAHSDEFLQMKENCVL